MFEHLLLQFYWADMFFECKIKCGKKNNFAGLNGNIFVQDFKIANMTTTSKSLVYSSHMSKFSVNFIAIIYLNSWSTLLRRYGVHPTIISFA